MSHLEQKQSLPLVAENSRSNRADASVVVALGRWLESGATAAKELLTGKKREPLLWGSQRYFQAAELSREPAEHELVYRQLSADLRSFFDEYALLRTSVTYEYGPNGMRSAYSESMSDIARNFVQVLETSGQSVERAKRDLHVAEYVEAWMHCSDLLPGEKLVTISPRDDVGYPGLDERNYIFINIFEKAADSSFYLKQFRSYEPQKKLGQLQLDLAALSHGQLVQADAAPAIVPAHAVATSILHVPPECSVSQLVERVYADKANWKTDIDVQLPKLAEAESAERLAEVVQFCMSEFSTLSNDESIEIANKNVFFDQLIVLVRKSFLKWVETHALNYQNQDEQSFELDFELIKEAWLAKRKKTEGTALTPEEKSRLSQLTDAIQLNSALPLESAASWAHCIIGSPASLLNTDVLSSLNSMPVGNSLLINTGVSEYFSQLNSQQKYQLKERMRRAVQITVHGETWFVPPEYLAEPGCYYSGELGAVVGPCRIPLTQDGLVFSSEVYAQLSAAFAAEELAAEALAALSAPQQAEAHRVIDQLNQIILAPSISLEQFVLQDILSNERQFLAYPLLHQLYHQLETALNPLASLQLLVATHLETDQLADITKEITLFEQGVSPPTGELTLPAGVLNAERSQRQAPLFQFQGLQESAAQPQVLAA